MLALTDTTKINSVKPITSPDFGKSIGFCCNHGAPCFQISCQSSGKLSQQPLTAAAINPKQRRARHAPEPQDLCKVRWVTCVQHLPCKTCFHSTPLLVEAQSATSYHVCFPVIALNGEEALMGNAHATAGHAVTAAARLAFPNGETRTRRCHAAGSLSRSMPSSLSTTSFIVGRSEGSFFMHCVPMLLTDSGTLMGNSRDLFWMVTWKMICTAAKYLYQTCLVMSAAGMS